jgi:hypothetical protein
MEISDKSEPKPKPYKMSCWTSCIASSRYLEARWKVMTSQDKSSNEREIKGVYYVFSEYEYNQRKYKIAVKINRHKTMTFLKAVGKRQQPEITEDITSLVAEWLGPNEDFHGTVVTPRLLGYHEIELSNLDTNTFETVSQVFIEDEPMSLVQSEESKKQSVSQTEPLRIHPDVKETTNEYWLESPRLIDDPREPRESPLASTLQASADQRSIDRQNLSLSGASTFSMSPSELKEMHYR